MRTNGNSTIQAGRDQLDAFWSWWKSELVGMAPAFMRRKPHSAENLLLALFNDDAVTFSSGSLIIGKSSAAPALTVAGWRSVATLAAPETRNIPRSPGCPVHRFYGARLRCRLRPRVSCDRLSPIN